MCFDARKLDQPDLVENSLVSGAVPLFEWLGDEAGTVFSY